ncbi:MAG: AAA family ATPase [Myxococcales bacterium]|nr:AAA family ATPase [Myxococcales bacterium]
MKIVSVINYKGGVGKTTLTANLAAELAWRQKRVLMIDLDPQTSLTFSFVSPDYWESNLAKKLTIKSWYDAVKRGGNVKLEDLVFTPPKVQEALKGHGQLDLIASHLGLINVDLELATSLIGLTLEQSKYNFLKVHRRLAIGLESIKDDYDIVLIDCPPNFNVVTKTAIVASSGLIIPAKPDYLSTLGVEYLHRSLTRLVKNYNDYAELDDEIEPIDPEIIAVVFAMVQYYANKPISSLRRYIRETRRLKVPVLDAMMRENKTLFSQAPETGVPVIMRRHNQEVYDNVVAELEQIVTELEPKIQ